MPTNGAMENLGLLAYFKQPELPLAPSSTLAGLCQALLLVVSLSTLLNTSSSQKCFLLPPQPLWPVMQPSLLISFSLSGLSHTAITARCCLRQPPMAYINQPEVFAAAYFRLSDLCHEATPARLLQPLLAYITLRST
jgi:hypothetical protein